MATFTMENDELELRGEDMLQGVRSLLISEKNGENHPNRVPPFICMVPRLLRDLSPSSFDPQVVSIGPLHREDVNVQAFEGQKLSYMINLMSRIENYSKEEIWDTCMKKAYTSMNRIKACYVWPKNYRYTDDQIAQMIVIDACFILEFLHSVHLRSSLISDLISRDLIILENQIPYFFLNDIFQCTVLKFDPQASLSKITLPFLFSLTFLTSYDITIDIISNDTHHILSLLHQCHEPNLRNIVPALHSELIGNFPSVIDLDTAGVSIKPNKNPEWVMGMQVKSDRFRCFPGLPYNKATLEMPKINVEDKTELVLRNLIAYEQLGLSTCHYFTSYACFIDALVNTKEDVIKLVDSGVIVNYLSSEEEVANMINNICKHLIFEEFYYRDQRNALNEYYNSYNTYWPKNIAWLRRTYFNSPWNIIALLAGIILFALTVVQTIFTVKSPESNK